MPSLIVMGVSGCGKSTVGRLLAGQLGLPFFDADEYHPPANIEKMRSGIPLTDADRDPWLGALHRLLAREESGRGCILACSALREAYRRTLIGSLSAIGWVYLRGTREELLSRLESREGHFMPASLLDSQLASLEEPETPMTFSITLPLDQIVAEVLRQYNQWPQVATTVTHSPADPSSEDPNPGNSTPADGTTLHSIPHE